MKQIKNLKRNLKKEYINWRTKFNAGDDNTHLYMIGFITFISTIALIVVTGEVGRFATPWIS